jgi:hypothetical protein
LSIFCHSWYIYYCSIMLHLHWIYSAFMFELVNSNT